MNFLKNILRGTARPAVTRPVPMVPAAKHPARSQAVEVLELRVQESIRRRPVVRVDDEPYQSPLMPVGRMRQAEENEAAQLKRELVMERMRVKELREQLEEAQKNRSTQALVGMLEGASAEAKCMELQAELREVKRQLEELRVRGSVMLEAVEKAAADPVYDYKELAGVGFEPVWEERWFFADEESEERFHRVRRGEILHGLIVIEGPPASGKTLMGTMLAGNDSARQWPEERVLERMVALEMRGVLFFDNIDTRYPYYRGEVPQPGGEKLHSSAIIEALGKEGPLAVILAGQHIALSPEMQRLAICIRLKGGAA